MWAWLRMLRSVPTGTSRFLGTIVVSMISSARRTNLTWLPFWLASTKSAASRRRLISRKGCGFKPPQPRPQSCGQRAVSSLAAARSAVPALLSGWQALVPRTHPGWRHRLPGIARRTNPPHAKRQQRTDASCLHSVTDARRFPGPCGSHPCASHALTGTRRRQRSPLPPISPMEFVPAMSLRPRSRYPHRMRMRRAHPSSRHPCIAAATIVIEAFRPHVTRTGGDSDHRIARRRRCEPHHHCAARGTPAKKRSGDHKSCC
jgi:hypothetical protein